MKTDTGPDPIITTYRPGSIGKIVQLHGAYYADNWNFGLYFETKVARELSDLVGRTQSGESGFWIAQEGGCVAGSIAIDREPGSKEKARLRFFIVDPSCSGKGIGNLLMETAMSYCREKGINHLFLTTFDGLDAARHLYEKWGFQLVSQEEDTTWGPAVNEQLFELVL